MQLITRKGNFDSGHRVMNEKMKCFNLHGHTYLYELTFSYEEQLSLGYALDFKEIKRVFCQWIDDFLDHGVILNPQDTLLINVSLELQSKLWLMSLNGKGEYCNPSVENIAKEILLAMSIISNTLYSSSPTKLVPYSVVIYETPNCYTTCFNESISVLEGINFRAKNEKFIEEYARNKGIIQYDDRL